MNASYLLSASVMATPGSLGISKLYCPETEVSKTCTKDIVIQKGYNVLKHLNNFLLFVLISLNPINSRKEKNALEAGANGANQALKLVAGIVANMIAILAFLRFLDLLTSWLGSLVEMDYISFKVNLF